MLNGRATAAVHARTKVSMSSIVSRSPLSANSSPANRARRSPGSVSTGQPMGDFDEQLVAGVMAEGVVHLFEAVEVEHDDERGRGVLERPSTESA